LSTKNEKENDYTGTLEYYKYYYEQKPFDPRLAKPTYQPKQLGDIH
jgi:hypothetical protein